MTAMALYLWAMGGIGWMLYDLQAREKQGYTARVLWSALWGALWPALAPLMLAVVALKAAWWIAEDWREVNR